MSEREPVDPQVGGTYEVTLQDCCVNVRFTATVEELEWDTGFLHARFDNGVKIWDCLRHTFRPADPHRGTKGPETGGRDAD